MRIRNSVVAMVAAAMVSAATVESVQAQGAGPDPRIGLRAGWMDAETAAWNLRLVAQHPRP